MKPLMERLQEDIKYVKDNHEDMDERSWGNEVGILISGNDAKKILSLYDFYRGVVNSHGVENNKEICKLSAKVKC